MSVESASVSHEPYWWDAAPPEGPIEVALPKRCDVAIIGAGYAGLSAALTLARAGRSVVVLEAAAPGEGASNRSGGMIGPLSQGVKDGLPPVSALRRHG